MSESKRTSHGRPPRFLVAAMSALTSALTLVSLVLQDVFAAADVSFSDLPWGLILRYLIALGAAGALLGFLLATLFGRRGVAGWGLSLIGGILVTFLSGILGSFLGLVPDLIANGVQTGALISVASGALLPLFALSGRPLLILLWLVLVLTMHVLASRQRQSGP